MLNKLTIRLVYLGITVLLLVGCGPSSEEIYNHSLPRICDGKIEKDLAKEISKALSYTQSDGLHKIVVFRQDKIGNFYKIPSAGFPNRDWAARNIEETELVTCLFFRESQKHGTCRYRDYSGNAVASAGIIETYDVTYNGILYEAKTGEVITTFQLQGPAPKCPTESVFGKTGEISKKYGQPDKDELFYFLQPYINPAHATRCSHVPIIKKILDEGFTCDNVVYITEQKADGSLQMCVGDCINATIGASEDFIRVEGVRVEVKAKVVLGGNTYLPGIKLTVDKDGQWVEVSEWN